MTIKYIRNLVSTYLSPRYLSHTLSRENLKQNNHGTIFHLSESKQTQKSYLQFQCPRTYDVAEISNIFAFVGLGLASFSWAAASKSSDSSGLNKQEIIKISFDCQIVIHRCMHRTDALLGLGFMYPWLEFHCC